MTSTTDKAILQLLKKTAHAADESMISRFSLRAVDSPDQLGIVACFVTCPDEYANRLLDTLNTAVDQFMAEVVGVEVQQHE